MRRTVVAIVCGAVALVGVAGYVVADVHDMVPGVLTDAQGATAADPPKIAAQSLSSPQIQSGWTGTDASNQDSSTPVDAASVQALWADVQKAAEDGKYQAWATVVDATTNQVLLDAQSQQAFTPASVTKTLTARVALEDLSATKRLATGTSLNADTLYLWGEGDLLLASGQSDPDAISGHAGVATLAQNTAAALKNQGVTSVTLNWQDALFEGAAHLAEWDAQGNGTFAGQVGPFAMDAGRTYADAYEFVADPPRLVADQLAEDLRSQGINVTLGEASEAPSQSTPLAQVESATVEQQIRWMLWHSDNTLAEQYCHLAAKKAGLSTTYESSAAHVADSLKKLGVPTTGLDLHDCSGLSENDRIAGVTLVENFRSAMTSDKPQVRDLVRSLPWAGVNGTLDSRLNEGNAVANVQAKTGSLGQVSSLAGVVTTKSGRMLIFAMGTDQVPDNAAWGTRTVLDAAVEGLASLP